VKVGRGVYHHFFLPECYRREENEGFHGDGHINEVCQSLDVPGCWFRGDVCRLKHGEDVVRDKILPGEGVG